MVFPLALGAATPIFADLLDVVAVKVDDAVLETEPTAFAEVGHVFVPMRSLMESQEWTITWIPRVNGALLRKGDRAAVIYTDKTRYDVDGVQKKTAAATKMYNDRLYCSADAAADILGMSYTYDSTQKTLEFKSIATTPEEDKSNQIAAYEDTYVQKGYPDDVLGGEDYITLKGNTYGDTHRIIYLKFDLTGVSTEEISKFSLVMNACSAEDGNGTQDYIFYELDADAWSETELTYNNRPKLGDEVARVNSMYSSKMIFDITDYVKSQLAKGKKKISVAVTGDSQTGTRVDYYSKEGGNGSYLLLQNSKTLNYQAELPPMEGYGQGQDPWEWAEKLYAESKYEKTEPYETEHVEKTAATIYKVTPSGDTYANSGEKAGINYGDSAELMIKSDTATYETGRRAFLKFNLDELPQGETLYSYLYLYTTGLQNNEPYPVEIYLSESNDWSQNNLTWNNMPSTKGGVIASVPVYQNSTWYKFDISDAVNEAKVKGQSEITLVAVDTGNRHTRFASSRASANGPYMEMCINDGTREEVTPSPKQDLDQYTIEATSLNKDNRSQRITMPTRTLETLPGYTMTAAEPQLGQYGGRLDRQYEATGFYYSKKIDGRWWVIDPEGHPMINIGVAVTNPNNQGGERLQQLMLEKFGSVQGWANETVDFLKNDLYFNGTGAWSSEALLNAPEPFGYTEIIYFMNYYMDSLGIGHFLNGSSQYTNGGLNVFDPDFSGFCDDFAAARVTQMKDSPRFMAWMADNELMADLAILPSFLMADWRDPRNVYSYAMAWTFLKHYTGKENPSIDDATKLAQEDFVDFIWDRYHNVVSGTIRKYDPNHMYWGTRALSSSEERPGFFAGASRYVDAMCCNYYYAWTPERDVTTRWNVWGYDTPYVITEWYAMAEDADPLLKNSGGAGFLVPTQEDRGLFYQNFALKLLESKNCLGFHWFTYQDNDPTAGYGDSSNIDSNKGLMSSITYEPYEALTTEMRELNRQAYSVIDYFDS